jgi:endonuclease/exonuclease/phosphatase family metal-dependent hydrolase
LKDSFDTEKLSGTTLHLSRKLGAAYKARAVQADTIASIRNRSPYKVIICGDFNDVPVSYAYTKIKGNLKDAFSETGFGLGWTLNLSIYKFRIDYVLYDATFTTNYFNISKVKYSDHYPVYCQLNIN